MMTSAPYDSERLRLRTERVASGYEVILVEGAQIINLHQALLVVS